MLLHLDKKNQTIATTNYFIYYCCIVTYLYFVYMQGLALVKLHW